MINDTDLALRQRAVARGRQLLGLAERHFARRMPVPDISFDLRGRAAGQVRVAPGRVSRVRYNLQLLAGNPADFLAQTVAHEIAHLVAYQVFGRGIRPHGPEWQAVMQLFGAPPQRCHSYQVDETNGRRLTRHAYCCTCRTHLLSSIRHNRAQRGQRYLCRTCGHPLRPGRFPGDSPGD